jgi:hypothetical protein
MAIAISRIERNVRGLGILLLIAAVLALPLLSQLRLGGEFLFGKLVELDKMGEVSGVFDFVRRGEHAFLMELYSYLLLLLPLGVVWAWWRLRARYSSMNLFFAVFALFGASLLLVQFRLQYFGSFALWLLPCLFVEDIAGRWTDDRRRIAIGVLAVVVGVAMLPSLMTLRTPVAPGADMSYMRLRDMYLALKTLCEQAPGVVLADHNHGHHITYHTNCSVISDNFVLTRQHEEKLLLTERLLRSTVEEVRELAPYVSYILIVRADDVIDKGCFPACEANRGLRHQLIEAAPPYPPGVRFLGETQAVIDGRTEPLARLFAIDPLVGDLK